MGLQPTADLNTGAGVVAGPFHPAFGELVLAALWRDALHKWLSAHPITGQLIEIELHPSVLSRLKGYRNDTFKWIDREFNPVQIITRTTPELPIDMVLLNGQACHLISR